MTELTERYVGATLRSLPESKRQDIEAELRAAIADAIDARVSNGEDPEAAEKAVLSELGDPARLAASYVGRPGYLIGPGLFFAYKRLLTVLLVTVTPVVMAVTALAKTFAGEPVLAVIGGTIQAALTLLVHMAFWTTLVFALIERYGRPSSGPAWRVSDLPPVGRRSIGLGETLTTIGVEAAVLVGMALFAQTDFSPITVGGEEVALIQPALWSFWLPYFMAVLVAEIVFEWVKYRVGRWTWPLASINLALNALFAVPAIYLLTTGRLLNLEFFVQLGHPQLGEVGSATLTITAMVVALIALGDAIGGFHEARR